MCHPPELKQSQMKRKKHLEKYNDFLENITNGKKQRRFRMNFKRYLIYLSETVFPYEEEEYKNIGKFGRGMWNIDQLKKTFSEEDLVIVREIAEGFGCFEY